MVLRETLPKVGWDVKILATDLDSNVLATAERGVYGGGSGKDLPRWRLRRWVQKGQGAQAGQVRVAQELRELITFRRFNPVSYTHLDVYKRQEVSDGSEND